MKVKIQLNILGEMTDDGNIIMEKELIDQVFVYNLNHEMIKVFTPDQIIRWTGSIEIEPKT